MQYDVRDTEPQDLIWMMAHMRRSDQDEVAAMSGSTAGEAMFYGRASCQYMKTALVEGIPLLVFGVSPAHHNPEVGIVWMLATDYIEDPRCRLLLARHSRKWVQDMQSRYTVLTNMTDKRNKAHHRWLQWCGFVFINEIPWGPANAPFLEFVRINKCVT